MATDQALVKWIWLKHWCGGGTRADGLNELVDGLNRPPSLSLTAAVAAWISVAARLGGLTGKA